MEVLLPFSFFLYLPPSGVATGIGSLCAVFPCYQPLDLLLSKGGHEFFDRPTIVKRWT